MAQQLPRSTAKLVAKLEQLTAITALGEVVRHQQLVSVLAAEMASSSSPNSVRMEIW